MPAYPALCVSIVDHHIAVVSLNRPGAANALNVQMALDLKAFFETSRSQAYRVVILTGQGKYFCAGADLKDRKGISDAQWQEQHATYEAALLAISHCDIPVIAAVSGAAMGGGLELALACDFTYAATNATFALPEASLGIMPGLGGTQNLPKFIGPQRAKECLFTGKAFSAQEAFDWGMVNRLCTPETLLAETIETARIIAAKAPLSVKAIKKAVDGGLHLPLIKALELELAHYQTLLPTSDRKEGVNAFNEKRKPGFTGS